MARMSAPMTTPMPQPPHQMVGNFLFLRSFWSVSLDSNQFSRGIWPSFTSKSCAARISSMASAFHCIQDHLGGDHFAVGAVDAHDLPAAGDSFDLIGHLSQVHLRDDDALDLVGQVLDGRLRERPDGQHREHADLLAAGAGDLEGMPCAARRGAEGYKGRLGPSL